MFHIFCVPGWPGRDAGAPDLLEQRPLGGRDQRQVGQLHGRARLARARQALAARLGPRWLQPVPGVVVHMSCCRRCSGTAQQQQRSSFWGVCHPETVQQHMHASAGACATDTLERSTSGAPWIAGRAAATAARQRRWPPQGPYSRARSAAQPCGAPTASAGRGRRRARSRARSTAPAAASTACVAACAQAARR